MLCCVEEFNRTPEGKFIFRNYADYAGDQAFIAFLETFAIVVIQKLVNQFFISQSFPGFRKGFHSFDLFIDFFVLTFFHVFTSEILDFHLIQFRAFHVLEYMFIECLHYM